MFQKNFSTVHRAENGAEVQTLGQIINQIYSQIHSYSSQFIYVQDIFK